MTRMTAGDLRAALEGIPDNFEVSFEGGLTFARLKRWGDEEFVICWSEIQAELSPTFKKKHPEVIAAFARFDDFGGVVESLSAPRL